MRWLANSLALVMIMSVGSACSSPDDSVETDQGTESETQTTDPSGISESGEIADTTVPTEAVAIGTEGLATYDESIPDGGYDAFYIYHEDLKSLATASDIIFTGRITNYVESALTVSDPDTASIGLQIDVYDGIVFTVEELIAGNLPDGTQEITILTFAMITDEHGEPIVRISDSPVEVVQAGIEQRNLPDGPMYLVFALREDDPSSPFYRSEFHYFNTPGSVVQLLDDGRLGVGVDKPLNLAGVTGVESSIPVNSLQMSDVRGVVNVTQESDDVPGAQPQSDEPGSQSGSDSTTGATSTE